MHKKRVLVIISFSFSIRYLIRTGLLNQMSMFCKPVIGVTWNEPSLMSELRASGFEVHIVPNNNWGIAYSNIRRKIDIWFRFFRLKSPSQNAEQKYLDLFRSTRQKVLRMFRVYYNILKLLIPGFRERLLLHESILLKEDTNLPELVAFVKTLNIDAVFTVTPFHRQEDILLRACKLLDKRMICSILSFDNITKRGWIPVEYDAYMVWNEDNKRQLFRIYPGVRNKPVIVTGAAQFDFYFQNDVLLSFVAWQQLIGIPSGNRRKIILYSGGPQALFPQEPLYLRAIDTAIRKGQIKDQPLVLFRCHPIDNIERWKKSVGESPNIIYDGSWTGKVKPGNTNITWADIQKLCSTLAYTDVHVNLCSTMTVDGAAFFKPQIGPAYMPDNMKGSRLLRNLYSQEHFLPVVESGILKLATSEINMIQLINEALLNENTDKSAYAGLMEKIISFCDGQNAKRVSNTLCVCIMPD